ncbi:PAS domain S-box protein [Desulforhabdus sp. TSK]|uniref:hybrid sensor histidine kinase/response regulator n=1 Tax=Desulforhabdus sp. TSK TaxID=2925014 RepID=UPI001FC88F61|nr:PAS domain S-box protein [Desulforhabdus sp. TSK]GKT08450.1 hypothetical protein DSTSK_17550 [Desulforhabdus sp. TSK]
MHKEAEQRDDFAKKFEQQGILLQTLMDTVPYPIFHKDPTGLYAGCNRAFENLVGCSREEVIGKEVGQLFPEALAKVYEANDRKAMENPGQHAYEAQLDLGNGNVRSEIINLSTLTDGHGSVAGLLGVIVDTTDRMQMEKTLVRLASAVEQAGEAIFITDVDGMIRYANASFLQESGYARAEILGRHVSDFKISMDGEAAQESLTPLKTLFQSASVWKGRYRRGTKQGSDYDVQATITPIKSGPREITHYVVIERNLTHEMQLERRLRQSQKLESIGTLAGGIAHDFNNILTSLLLYAELAQNEVSPGGSTWKKLDQIVKAGQRARDLVRQILTFSREGEKEVRPITLAVIVKEASHLIRATLPSTVLMRHDIQAPRDMIMADPTQMHQVVMNLCTNAAHALRDKGGTLQVTLSAVELNAESASFQPGLKPGQYLKLTVSDTGQGIPPELLGKIFDPYFSTKPKSEGTGLGLAVTHGIVKSHHGAINVQSVLGKGTVFEVLFPRLPMQTAVQPEQSALSHRGTERILLVDDEPWIVKAQQEILQRLGYHVTAKTSPLEALETFQSHPQDFDLMITDQTMPRMTGKELAGEIRKTRRDLPVILCTGFSPPLMREEMQELGIRQVIQKPALTQQVAETIRRVLDGREPQG